MYTILNKWVQRFSDLAYLSVDHLWKLDYRRCLQNDEVYLFFLALFSLPSVSQIFWNPWGFCGYHSPFCQNSKKLSVPSDVWLAWIWRNAFERISSLFHSERNIHSQITTQHFSLLFGHGSYFEMNCYKTFFEKEPNMGPFACRWSLSTKGG